MSFQNAQPQPWYLKIIDKGLPLAAGILCCILTIPVMISLNIGCIFAGIFIFLTGLVVIITEAPFCFAMFPKLQRLNDVTEKFTLIHRIIVYIIAAIVPLVLCFGISCLLASLILGGCGAYNVWKFLKFRRMPHDQHPPEDIPQVMGQVPPNQYTQVGAQLVQDPYMQNIASGAAKGAVHSMMTQQGHQQPQQPNMGGYPGF